MRRLARTLMAGGVVYPAGTAESDIAVKVKRDDVWDQQASNPDEEEAIVAGYADLTKAKLLEEIEKRNANRDPEGDTYLDGSGNKADLVAALEADDKAQA